jgi:hypothetical protein
MNARQFDLLTAGRSSCMIVVDESGPVHRRRWSSQPLLLHTNSSRGYTNIKKTWIKPELIKIVRGTPEEAVLSSCKTIGGAGSLTPGTDYSSCFQQAGTTCGSCLAPYNS